jgi:hypothetical protein
MQFDQLKRRDFITLLGARVRVAGRGAGEILGPSNWMLPLRGA